MTFLCGSNYCQYQNQQYLSYSINQLPWEQANDHLVMSQFASSVCSYNHSKEFFSASACRSNNVLLIIHYMCSLYFYTCTLNRHCKGLLWSLFYPLVFVLNLFQEMLENTWLCRFLEISISIKLTLYWQFCLSTNQFHRNWWMKKMKLGRNLFVSL